MFPEEYTPFTLKHDASYDGDPAGDYILAEHINTLQQAAQRIEQAIGLEPNPDATLTERIRGLERLKPLRVPNLGIFTGSLGSNASTIISPLSSYALVILSERGSYLPEVAAGLAEKHIPVYGQIDAQQPLAVVQTEIGEWAQVGAVGIYLKGFGDGVATTRNAEQALLDSVQQVDLSVLLSGRNPARWLENHADPAYNPDGLALTFPPKTLVQLRPFGYGSKIQTSGELMVYTLPLMQAFREREVGIIGMADTPNEKAYQYVQAAGLLFGLDYLYNGPFDGTSLGSRTPHYSWPSYLGEWRTNDPLIFQDGTSLYRDIPNGRIRIRDDLSMQLEGYTLDSSLLNWSENSIPGFAIADASITPSKLTTYDIAKIVELLNTTTDENLKIDSVKIAADPDGAGLPINIPSSNMKQNVVQAINERVLFGAVSSTQINDAAIESLSASKLTGSIPMANIESFVIPAINKTASLTNFINVPLLKAINLESTGTISANAITGDSISMRAGAFTEALSTADATVSNYFTGKDGEFFSLYVEKLTAKSLTGLESLHLKTLSADNIGTLVIDAINANIANGTFNNIVTEALTATTIKTNLITALNSITTASITNSALFGTAVITDASIANLSASKLTAGSINTALINLSSPDGHLQINDRTMKIYDSEDAQQERRLRVQIGDISEWSTPETPADFGLLVLGEDGTTRLYDHTGVYNAGIKNNAISNLKIQDNAISDRVIQAGAIYTRHLTADVIQADHIAANQILAKHILAETITGDKIAGATITAGNLAAGSIEAGHILAGQIDAGHIKAGAITADRLAIGYSVNLIKNGFDSFEQQALGTFNSILLAGTAQGEIVDSWNFDGNKSLYLNGTNVSNRIRLDQSVENGSIVLPGRTYMLSVYARTFSTNNVPIRIGLAYNTGAVALSPILTLTNSDRVTRRYASFTVPESALRASVVLSVETTNTGVYFDCLQLEELEANQTEPGSWKSTATTVINGNNITTGRIDAARLHIGAGTVFGNNNDIIDITDAGIKAKSSTGWAMLNSKGLEIQGGAFKLASNNVDGTNVTIDGTSGMTVETSHNRIELDAVHGLRVINKDQQQIMLDVDPNTGQVRVSGRLIVYDANNPLMQWTMEEKIATIESNVSTQTEDLLATQQDVTNAQNKLNELENSIVYKVDLTSTKGLTFKNGNLDTEIFATVYHGANDITATLPVSAFVWQKTDSAGVHDTTWETAHATVGARFPITYSEVNGKANIFCLIDIPET